MSSGPSGPGGTTYSSTIDIAGSITGGAHDGVYVTTEPGNPDFYSSSTTSPNIIVREGGAIAGAVGIEAVPDYSGYFNRVDITLDNSGSISGASGIALRGDDFGWGRFESIVNRATGVIGAIQAQAGQFLNQGLIDGGARSAYVDAATPYYGGQGTIANEGTIRSSGSSATLYFNRTFNPDLYVDNSGLIENTGGAPAVGAVTYLTMVNAAVGVIRSNGTAIEAPVISLENDGRIEGGAGVAIRAGLIANVVNRGTIAGDIVAVPPSSYSGSVIDNSQGVVEGNILLGDGDDVFIVSGSADRPFGTVTGIVDAGGGTDSLRRIFTQDTTLTGTLELPATIERFQFRVGEGSTLTLGESFVSNARIAVGGGDPGFYNTENQMVNRGTISTVGTALESDYSASGGMAIVNEGTIRATLSDSDDYAVYLRQESNFENRGIISAAGGGGVRMDSGYIWSNSGTIEADGTAVYTRSDITNSGTIRSTAGLALDLENAYSQKSTNSGTIDGALAGARLYYSTLVNTGTITSANTGVEIGIFGRLINQAGGVISGGNAAVTAPALYPGGTAAATIINAGTINGDVDFGDYSFPYGSSNVFIALDGGTLNGNLHLGSGGDTFVTRLENAGSGAYLGVSGAVTGGGFETIRYVVNTDSSATLAQTGIFQAVGYELTGGAALTLTAPQGQALSTLFTGTGTVDMTADLVGPAGYNTIDLRATTLLPTENDSEGQAPANAVHLISRGTISKVADTGAYDPPIVAIGPGNVFENVGTIAATGPGLYGFIAIGGTGTVDNKGSILLNGADGVSSVFYSDYSSYLTVINSGSIVQTAGGASSRGIIDAVVENSGLIDTQGTAISYQSAPNGEMSVTNSGTIRSAAQAIMSSNYRPINVFNESGGRIEGGAGVAIDLQAGGTIENSGTIVGDVNLGLGAYNWYSSPSTFISNGTLEGDLTFGDGDDIFLQRGSGSGVTGTIDAGGGRNAYGRSYAASQQIALGGTLPGTFEDEVVEAIGSGTTLTLTGSTAAGGRTVITGDGQFVNEADIGGTLRAYALGNGSAPQSVTNNGSIGEGFYGTVSRFVNNGSIGGSIGISSDGGTTFINNGTVDGDIYFDYLTDSDDVVDNRNGTISGYVYMGAGDDRLIINADGLDGINRYSGGDGTDTLEFAGGGTDEAPATAPLFGNYEFENLVVSGGVLKLRYGFGLLNVDVTGGRLIGSAGTTLFAETITVGAGGIFGSAGTVVGNIDVAGTLSPGASPGTMTVQGNVSLATGSTTLFEMTPTISDAIVIDGALSIASGATLKLTGVRPLTPGTAYDLITASEGITGAFTTIDKAAGVVGYIQQGEDSIQLLGQFALNPASASDPQAVRVSDYLNDLLVGGTATAGIMDAIPDLLDADGFADARKLRQLSPEAYASASQIGVENGLALASAGRSVVLTERTEAGPFTFGQWFGNWRTMPGRDGLGTAKADISTRGLMGGIGFGSEQASVGAFVGYIDAKQQLSGLGAKTDSDGAVAGIIGHLALDGFEIGMLTAFDGSTAETSRALPDASTARSRYRMRGWTTDATIGYAFDIGGGWSMKPSMGITHIRSVRRGTVETSGSPLALTVAGRKTKATFLNADVAIGGSIDDRIRPWLSAGVRHQLNGEDVIATGALVGVPAAFSLPGAPRDRTQANVSAGLGAAISPMATLFFGISSEFGANSNGQSANGGLKLRF